MERCPRGDTTWWARLLRPAPVRCLSDVLMWGGNHLGSGDSGLASIKTQKAAPLYGPAVYLLQGGDVQRVQLLLQFHPFTHDDLGDYLLCGPGGTALSPVCMPRMAAATLAIACLTGAGGRRADGRRPERRLCLEWQGVLFPAVRERLAFFPKPPSCIWAGWTGASALPGTGSRAEDTGSFKTSVGGNGQGAV